MVAAKLELDLTAMATAVATSMDSLSLTHNFVFIILSDVEPISSHLILLRD